MRIAHNTRPRFVWTEQHCRQAEAVYAAMAVADGGDDRRGVKLHADKVVARALNCELMTVTYRRLQHGPTFGHARGEPEHADKHAFETRMAVSARMIAERDARRKALDQRDLTAILCGDPPPGFSARDKQ